MTRLLPIVQGAPLWVWPLLALLLFLGIRSLRTRAVPVASLVALPLAFFGLSVSNLLPLDHLAPLRIGVWVAALLVGTVVGWLLVRPQRIAVDRARKRIAVPGSVVPLLLMLAAFAGGFYFGYLFARYPELRTDPTTLALASTYRGLMSGYFLGQTLRLFRLYFAAPQPTVST
ncbi:MAG: DUF6622 family protein [Reyranellaceae bacterium]